MPLIPKRSKEMPMEKKSSSLGMAYDMKNRSKRKKMAKGGPVSAKSEKRPMPEQMSNDAKQANKATDKPPVMDSATSRPDKVSLKGRTFPLKQPKMASSGVFQAKLRDQEGNLIESEAPDKPSAPPPKAYFEGGEVSQNASEEDGAEHPEGLESDNDEMSPSKEEIMGDHFADGGSVKSSMEDNFGDTSRAQDYQNARETKEANEAAPGKPLVGPTKEQYEEYNSPKNQSIRAQYRFAEGGEVDMGQPDEEEAIEHAASIASAIMSKRRKMAEGGQVDIESNNEEQPNGYYDRNEDAALKENYDSDMEDVSQPEESNEHGDSREMDEENEEDSSLVGKIRRKMKSSPISR